MSSPSLKSRLFLSPRLRRMIDSEGESAYPNECCGVLIGRDEQTPEGVRRMVESLKPLANSFEEGEQFHRFSLNPLDLARAEKEAGEAGKLVLGFYHSHPDHPARPSEYDRVHAWPFYSYVIVAIANKKAAVLTSWQLNAQTEQFEEEQVVTAE